MLQFRSTAVRAELELATALARLRTLIGRSPGDPIDLADDLRVAEPAAGVPDCRPQSSRLALATRPDLRSLQLGQARSVADLRLQESLGVIDYTVGAEYRRQQGIAGRSNSLGFFVSAPIPILNRNQGEIARADAEHDQLSRQIGGRPQPDSVRRRHRVSRVHDQPRSRDCHRTRSDPARDERPRHLHVHVPRGRLVASGAARRTARVQRHDAELSRRTGRPAASRRSPGRRRRHGGDAMKPLLSAPRCPGVRARCRRARGRQRARRPATPLPPPRARIRPPT